MTSLAIEEWGSGTDLPAIVLLHGALGTRRDWEFVKDTLPFRTLAIDLPAHGDSARTNEGNPWSFDEWHRAFWKTLAMHDVKRPILVGYSMGGRLALTAAAATPKGVAGLILLAAGFPLDDGQARVARKARDQRWADLVREATTAPARRAVLEEWWGQDVFGDLRAHPNYPALLHERSARPFHHSANVLASLGTGEMPSVDRSALADVPLHYVAGERDAKYRGVARRIAGKAPQWTAEVHPNCGHALLTEATQNIASIILRESKRMGALEHRMQEEAA